METKKLPIWQQIQFRIIIALIIVLLLNTTISNFILSLIEMTNINLGIIGIWINNLMNIVVTTFLIGGFLRYYILKPIKDIEQKIQQFENGELDTRIQLKENNEIGILGSRLNKLFASIEDFQLKQQDQIHLVEERSTNISDRVNNLTDEIKSISEHFEDISATSQEQLGSFEETTAVADNMNNQFQTIAEDLSNLTNAFHHMKTKTEDGVNQINDSSQTMEKIADHSEKAKNKIVQLADEIGRINEVVTLINDISEQTNLLALNASIEAARAGEHGKGFSVVAEEVRKLAERSVEATEQITKTVDHILEDVQNIASQSEDRANNINNESSKILKINSSFEEIASTIITNIKSIEKINTNSQDVSKASLEITTTMEQVTSKTEDTTERIMHLNTTLTDQLTKTEEVQQEVTALKASF